jgi:para-aminobenzoate synthetase
VLRFWTNSKSIGKTFLVLNIVSKIKQIEKLQEPRHGIVRPLDHSGEDIFKDVGSFQVTSYHSLRVKLNLDASMNGIQHLAWDITDPFNGKVLMAARHISRPLWGVQYHPESICTDLEGQKVIVSWWREAVSWNSQHRQRMWQETIPPPIQKQLKAKSSCESSMLADAHFIKLQEQNLLPISGRVMWEAIHAPNLNLTSLCETLGFADSPGIILKSGKGHGQPVIQELGRFSIIGLLSSDKTLNMQYNVSQKAVTFKIMPTNKQATNGHKQGSLGTSLASLPTSARVTDFWSYVKRFMSKLRVHDGNENVPFWGGLIGYVSYEAGLETISVEIADTMESITPLQVERPDVQFLFVERSIVIDHLTDIVYVQSLRDDQPWIDIMKDSIQMASRPAVSNHQGPFRSMNGQLKPTGTTRLTNTQPERKKRKVGINMRSWIDYAKKISLCDNAIRDGDSYELCLTDNTEVYTPHPNSDMNSGWQLFKKLSTTNPAPFSAYIRLVDKLEGLTIVSSSPERFLRWTRDGYCQFRPIKGTVKKTPGTTFEDASKILNSSKERAENLMITDLIRHDLHGVVGTVNVSVPKLMQIEEYATVYQLVSVIEGCGLQSGSISTTTINEKNTPKGPTTMPPANGIDVLAASLPPGSMTGAPKKRSCELLAEIERHKPRGIYSGVIGYIDVGGGGDFSVVIRTAYKWDSDKIFCSNSIANPLSESADALTFETSQNGQGEADVWEKWTIGAGGAITAQSDSHEEYQEMLTKLNSVLGAYNVEITTDPVNIQNDPGKVAELQEQEEMFIQQGQPFQNILECDRPNT